MEVHEGGGQLLGAVHFHQPGDQILFLLARCLVEDRIGQKPFLVAGDHLVGRRRMRPGGGHVGAEEQALGLAALVDGHDQRADALVAGAAGAARTVQQRLGIGRQVGMDDEVEARQVDTAGGDVGRDADAGAAVAHGLQGVRPLVLSQFARERHDVEVAVVEACRQVIDRRARRAEHDSILGIVEAQGVDDGVLAIGRRDEQRAVLDVGVLLFFRLRRDAHRVALVALGELGDAGGYRGGEHQRAPALGSGFENELEVLAEAEVEHLVGLVEHGDAQFGHVERAAADVVADAARRADDDMGASLQRPALVADVHAADAGGDHRPGHLVEPFQLPLDLDGEFARRRDDEGQRRAGATDALAVIQERRRHGDAEGNGLAGTRLRRD